jgi:hypothetical protein
MRRLGSASRINAAFGANGAVTERAFTPARAAVGCHEPVRPGQSSLLAA